MQSESEEYIEELVISWRQVYKKSITSILILKSLENQPKWSQQIHQQLELMSGSKLSLDQRSLHRALRRLNSSGLIELEKKSGEKREAKHKFYKITEDGRDLLNLILDKYWVNL